MKKIILVTSTVLLTIFLYVGCKKNDEKLMPINENYFPVDSSISLELETLFNSLEVATPEEVSPENIVLPSGTTMKEFADIYFPDLFAKKRRGDIESYEKKWRGLSQSNGPQTQKDGLITLLYARSLQLVYPVGPFDNGQTKYAYVYGSTNELKKWDGSYWDEHGVKQHSPTGCDENLYGLDCNGFIYRVFQSVGIELKGQARRQASKSFVQQQFDAKFKNTATKIDVSEFILNSPNEISEKKIESGDILGYYDGSSIGHIGWAYKDKLGNLYLFQSDGKKENSCTDNKAKGPVCLKKGVGTSWSFWLNKKINVVRWTVDISGNWQLLGKCVAQNYNIVDLVMNISKVNGTNKFTGSGTGQDYAGGGGHFTITITGDYDELNSKISSAQMQWDFEIGNPRTDNIPDISLKGIDETGFIKTNCISGCNCPFEINLINKSK